MTDADRALALLTRFARLGPPDPGHRPMGHAYLCTLLGLDGEDRALVDRLAPTLERVG